MRVALGDCLGMLEKAKHPDARAVVAVACDYKKPARAVEGILHRHYDANILGILLARQRGLDREASALEMYWQGLVYLVDE